MQFCRLKTCHMINPVGFDAQKPFFTWNAESDGKNLQWARIEISQSPDFSSLCYDSGRREDILPSGFEADFQPQPAVRYYWRVSAAADNGDTGVSEAASFEPALSPEALAAAKWIAPTLPKDVHPVMEKAFSLPADVSRGRMTVCGFGVYEVYVNGEKAGNEYLAPGFYPYDFETRYQTYDVTNLLKAGENTVRVILGNGWYKGRFGFDTRRTDFFGDTFCLIARVDIDCADGTKTLILTDEDWRCYEGQTLESSIYDGEVIDLTKAPGPARPVKLYPERKAPLVPRVSLPIVIHQRLAPAEIIHTPAGETVLDFGQNMTGWVEFVCRAPKGEKVTLSYGEILQNDCFYQDNLRTAKAAFTVISDGENKVVRPRFTFFGFRFVKVEGMGENPDPKDFSACVIFSDLEETGFIETGDPMVNRLFLNALWGNRSNFLDVPTDCPQRDERMGWTGDTQVFSSTASFNMDASPFYRKFMRDMRLEQSLLDGGVPHVVPDLRNEEGKSIVGANACAWADSATVVPWTVYVHSGDKTLLREEYPSMKMWADWLKRADDADGAKRLWQTGSHFADWLALDNYKDPHSCNGGTDQYYIASAYYFYSVSLTAKAAAVLGYDEDAAFYSGLAGEIREAIRKEYFSPNGRCTADTETAYVLALKLGLFDNESRLLGELLRHLEADNWHLRTGFVGTPWLCPVLSEKGAHDKAVTLFLQKDYPSWLYEVSMGATTIWERWNSVLPDGMISDTGMNSLNHYAYGSIADWMYRCLAGINPIEEAPGYREFVLAPLPDQRLGSLDARVITPYGKVESAWHFEEEGGVTLRFKVPFGAKARLTLPGTEAAPVDGAPAAAPGEEILLPAGSYTYRCRL